MGSIKRFMGGSEIPRNGLIAEYLFNGNANDTSGNGYNGIVNGATLTTDRNGVSNAAYSFNGTSSYISIPSSFAFNVGCSISFWANFWNVTSANYMLGNGSLGVRYNGLNFLISVGQGGINLLNWTKVNRQVNVVIIRTSLTNYDYYIDGYFLGSQSTGGVTTTLTLDKIGMQSSGFFFNGVLDNFRFYNRTLTQTEITQLYNE